MVDFEGSSWGVLVLALALGAAVVWIAGTRVARDAEQVTHKTGLGGAVVGMVLLGLITSLPELATSATAALGGDAPLAVNNLLGGVAFQVVVLAVADAFGRGALTSQLPRPSALLQGVLCIVLLALALGGVIVEDPAIGGQIGAAGLVIGVGYLGSMLIIRYADLRPGWRPTTDVVEAEPDGATDSWGRVALGLVVGGSAILVAGYVLTRASEALAAKAGVETGLIGLTLLAACTSLPELSSAIAATRRGQGSLAIGGVFGGNMGDLGLILFVDAVYAGPPVLQVVDRTSLAAAVLAILLTAIYLIAMLERRDATVLRMGWDSAAVLVTYAVGVAIIAFL